MTTFEINGRTVSVHSPDDTPLLWDRSHRLQIWLWDLLRRLHGACRRTRDEILYYPA